MLSHVLLLQLSETCSDLDQTKNAIQFLTAPHSFSVDDSKVGTKITMLHSHYRYEELLRSAISTSVTTRAEMALQ